MHIERVAYGMVLQNYSISIKGAYRVVLQKKKNPINNPEDNAN